MKANFLFLIAILCLVVANDTVWAKGGGGSSSSASEENLSTSVDSDAVSDGFNGSTSGQDQITYNYGVKTTVWLPTDLLSF